MCVLWGVQQTTVSPIGWVRCMCVLWGLVHTNVLDFTCIDFSHIDFAQIFLLLDVLGVGW